MTRRGLEPLRVRLTNKLWVAAAFSVLVISCSGPTSGSSPVCSDRILLLMGESHTLQEREFPSGRLLRSMELQAQPEAHALSPGGDSLFIGLRSGTGAYELALVDLSTFSLRWSTPIDSAMLGGSTGGWIQLGPFRTMSVGPSGATLYLYQAVREGVPGFARVDLESRLVTAFFGPLKVSAAGVAVPSLDRGYQQRVIAVAGGRAANRGPRVNERIFILSASEFAPIDSITTRELGAGEDMNVWEVVPAAAGRELNIGLDDRLVRYDFVEDRLIHSVTRPANGLMIPLPSQGDRLLLTDGGTWPHSPGSGLVFVLGSSLRVVDSVDVSSPIGGEPHSPTAVRTLGSSSSTDRRIYLMAGTPPRGTTYPPQPSRILGIC